ncbi:MAG: RdgB/HAM1 family non-canonical purine NTP pyrophosphatase [Gammaproteobacteria bacterium]|nr:RdgB/HAM1 family non-canonical purine NTP pyrophosphatase [Gammaproteobacteria bacterium]
MRDAVLASANAGKLAELSRLLAPTGIVLRPMSVFGLESPEEDGATFIENALIKARHASLATGLPAIADDSGLVVPALGGAPGLLSSRYSGEDATAEDNNRKLIAALDGVEDRHAYFYCALVFIERADDPVPIFATAAWNGRIVDAPRGTHGFGYDPHFLVPELGATAAELAPQVKNAHSHRGIAARRLAAALRHVQRPDAP